MLMRHTLIYSLSRGLAGVFNIVAIMALTRLLPPSDYGVYTLMITSIMLVNAVFFQWLRMSLLRYYESNEDRVKLLSTICIGFHLIMLASLVLCVLAAALWADFRASGWVIVETFAYLWLFAWFELSLTLYRAQLQPGPYGKLFLSKNILTLSIAVLLVALGYGIHGVMIGMIGGTLVPVAIMAVKQWREVRFSQVDYKLMASLVKYGAPLTVSFTMSFIIFSAGRVMLGWMDSVAATGLYAVSYDFTQQSVLLLMTIVNLAAYPLVVKKLEKQGEEAARSQLKQNAVLLLLLSVPATAGLVVLTPNIAYVLLGEAYRDTAAVVFPIVALAAFIQGIKTFYFDLSFQMSRQTNKQMIPVLAAVAANILLNLWWIPSWGIMGAAYAALVSYAIGTAMSIGLGQKLFRLPFPMLDGVKIILAAIAMSLVLLPLRSYTGVPMLAVQVICGGIAFYISAWLLRVNGVKTLTASVVYKLKRGRARPAPVAAGIEAQASGKGGNAG
jgi:O-antigen/teichoic acid export membrane protein